jgi:cysteinyl-tRNA synthetase
VIRLHDTMTREKRVFEPAEPKRITMYVCGPTVYGRAHIGNARPAVVFDLLRRVLEHEYPDAEVIYARNVTDVDDKIIASAEQEGVDPSVITERYERFYLEDMGALGVNPPTIAPHATQEIGPMIAMIERLIETGNAYEAEGHVLFSVPSDPGYGALSRRDRDAMVAGARVEVAPYKRDPADFVLWKPSDAGVIGWESPWGRGRPGWHIECSAMIRAHLGETIDVHGGGLDLIFPHHENEIAQSRCAHGGAPLARYWVHNGFVDMGSEKMSKSLGNIVTPAELLELDPRGEIYRFALLSAHYRQPLAWTDELIAQSKSILNGLYRKVGNVEAGQTDQEFVDALADDLNTPLALARLYQVDDPATLKASANLIGLLQDTEAGWFGHLPMSARGTISVDKVLAALLEIDGVETTIPNLVELRKMAKAEKKFEKADHIRDFLRAQGVQLLDRADGTTDWERV